MGRKGFLVTQQLRYALHKNIAQITTQADITALGVPNYKGRNGKRWCSSIDVGITRVADETAEKGYIITGDVDLIM
jgi:methylenetetrahydrofolate dehydrogenase (NADP+)/methenyltetrahydrofolate cyclohydrolase